MGSDYSEPATMAEPLTPAQLGFRMPAEWELHAGTWLTWPRPDGISFPARYFAVPPVYAKFIQQLQQVEEVHINVWDADMEYWVRSLLAEQQLSLERLHFHHFPAYEPWCRDHGPIFLARENNGVRERAITDWAYNAWGGRYPPFDLDDAIPQHIARLRQLPVFSPGIVLEGGSIDVNGRGTLLTSESCLLNPNRNPHLTKSQIEKCLCDYLGVTNILWLGEGIVGDDTDGHIDDLARFVDPTTIVTMVEEDPSDANHQILEDNLRRLRDLHDQDGNEFRVVTLPMPGAVKYQGQRLPASYANFYIANHIVIVPTYRDPNDAEALSTLRRLFPRRRVIGIDSTDLIWGLGSFHCISQQEPA
jgi:agmatine deiminase